ncbi:acyl-homoserine-lactone acylase [Lentzea atacamensis]|uniref:Acyl-homoserine-lactone acylase n=1 Tax=Lentzea atacamensis TaxID=531938 RepID=A0ABX9EIN5_9PSEU|nr:penicillin acylase family protein [Lentzea atacamensis]RAS70006.1 acyl-homoserine-lactone acylase [Lentzea atacamensis]
MRLIVMSLTLLLALPAVSHAGGEGATIRRTSYGIPHVRAADHRNLGLGLGYAFAEDNACMMADIVVTLEARRSRWFGQDATTESGENNLVSDLYHQRVNQSGVIERALSGQSRQARDLVRGYVTGFNRYLARTGVADLPDARCRGAAWVRPITELDVWRRVHQIAGITGGEGLQEAVVAAQPPGAPAPTKLVRRPEQRPGSNGFGLGRTATGGTGMVLGNPHFMWDDDMRFYQQHLTIPGELNVSGAGLYGVPLVNIGHNDRLGWTHTASEARTITISRLTLVPGDPTSYLVDGRPQRMTAEQVTVPVRQADGSVKPVTRTLYGTPDGPVVADPGPLQWTTTNAHVLRDANFGNLAVFDQWLAIARARSVKDLHQALVRHQALPWVNTLAADSTGAAYYSDVQIVPHVTDELRARCGTGPDVGLVILDGSRSSCGWGTDADAVRPGTLGPARLPHLFRDDHVSNMNDSPWLANPAAPLTGYPAIVGDTGTERSPRTRIGLDMIADRLDGSDGLGRPGFTLSTLEASMFGNRNLTAEEGLKAVVALCQANPTLHGVDAREACATLAKWSGTGDTGEQSRGAFFWRTFISLARRPGIDFWLVPYDPADPARTPRGLNTADPGIGRAFADTVRAFANAGLPVDVKLDDVQHYEGIPIHGCRGPEGCFNVISVPGVPRPLDRIPRIPHGTSFVMAVELTKNGPRMSSLLVYGQSADKASPHHHDQAHLYVQKKWVSGRFSEQEIARDPNLKVQHVS